MKHYSLILFGKSVWSHYYHNKSGWFRFFGRGFSFKDVTIHPLLFGEMNGYKKGYIIGRWWISYLPKKD